MNVPSGYTALDLIGFTDKGDYSSSATYVKNDLVHHNNSIWRCLVDDTTAVTPAEGANWTVYIQNGTTLNGMADVNLTTPANGDLLRYNSTSSKWENQDVDSTPTQSSTKPVQSGGVYTQLANKANTADLATVATTGAYSDLSGTPSLAAVATSGAYSDLSGQPTIPTVNDATLTIQKNGSNVQTFTANSNTNKTANITVPDVINDLSDVNISSVANEEILAYDSATSKWKNSGALGDVKQALSNEVVTRAKLGAHNLFDYNSWVGSLVVHGTAVFENNGITLTATSSDCYVVPNQVNIPVKEGETIELTWDIQETDNMGNVILFPNNTSTGSVSVASNVKKISYTPTSGVSFISFRVGCYRSGTTAHYKNIKVCLASDPYTEWTPYAPTNSQLLSYKDNGVLGAKNLFHLSSITNTSADITTVDNGDGTVTVSGTPTSSLTFFLKSDRPLEAGQYNFSGLAGTTNLSIYKLYLYNGNTVIKEVLGTSITVVSSDVHTEVRVAVKNIDNNVAVSGTIKPMIRLASDTDPTYQPYAMTNKELSEEEEITIGTAPAPTLTIKRFGKVCNFYAKYNGLDDTAGQILIGTITNSKFIPKYGYAIAPLYDVSIQQSYAPKGSMWINSENGKVYLYKPTADTSGYVMGTYIAN